MTQMTAQRLRGQIDALRGHDRYYGCHYGMRSTLEHDKNDYYCGYDEVELAIRTGK
jgi:hypothetical protein